jgi:serine kinase of HPr protein (carbohydrate metabolism regulator)
MMSSSTISSETLHVSCVAKDGAAILIGGKSGAGKSDLALRLIDRGAILVSDDYTLVKRSGRRLVATAPATIAGKLEVRGLGIVDLPCVGDIPVCLYVDLDGTIERLPTLDGTLTIAGIGLPVIALDGAQISAAVKVELALALRGLKP